jgi:hypothetical protein
VLPTQPCRRGSDLCASMEQSQTLEVDGGRDGRRTPGETEEAEDSALAGVLHRGQTKEQPDGRRGEGRVPDEAPSAPVATRTRPLRREDFGSCAMSQTKYTKLYLEAKELRRRVAAAEAAVEPASARGGAAACDNTTDAEGKGKIPRVRQRSRTGDRTETEAGPSGGGAPGERIPPDPEFTPPTTGASTERPRGTPPAESPYQRFMRRQAQGGKATVESGDPPIGTESWWVPTGDSTT